MTTCQGNAAEHSDHASRPEVTFYYPGIVPETGVIPECNGHYSKRTSGNFNWTVKTYGYLRLAGFECRLARSIPDEGIVITHRDFLPDDMKPGGRQLLVCAVADNMAHPYAQVHILQNPADPMMNSGDALWPSFFVPHWTESGLVPRDPGRGDRFENVAYLGSWHNLAPQLKTRRWTAAMERMGLKWHLPRHEKWNDYSHIDAVLAVRSFTRHPYHKTPATKLYNAWLAGVPGIFGTESALACERKNPLDFIEVKTPAEAVAALERLQKDREFRERMAANGRLRACEVSIERLTHRWARLITEELAPACDQWRQQGEASRQEFIKKRRSAYRGMAMRDYASRAFWEMAVLGSRLFRR
jgi:hypothetical protein